MKLADLSGKRQNQALGALTQSEKALIENAARPPKREIPAELSAQVFSQRVGIGDDEDQLLIDSRLAYNCMSTTLQDLYDRERAICADSSQTSDSKVLSIDRIAKAHGNAPAEKLDSVRRQLKAGIAEIDNRIDGTFRARMKPEELREIRQHVSSLSDKARRALLADADDDVLSAVLSAKPFLSGLKPAEASMLRDQTIRRRFPDELKRREKFQKAVAQIDLGWTHYMKHITALYQAEAAGIGERAQKAREAAQV